VIAAPDEVRERGGAASAARCGASDSESLPADQPQLSDHYGVPGDLRY